jgi:hypothetical protein
VIEALGRRASDVLSERRGESSEAWTTDGLLTREALTMLVAAELSRMERESVALSLFVFDGEKPATTLSERTAIAQIAEGRFGAMFVRETDEACRDALFAFVDEARRSRAFGGGAGVSLEGGFRPVLAAPGVILSAEGLLEKTLRSNPGTVERVVVRRESVPIHDHH